MDATRTITTDIDVRLALSQPARVWSRTEVLERPCPTPAVAGIYAWYFNEVPADVTTEGAHQWLGLTRLYVGISPGRPAREDGRARRQTLRHRIRYHYRGNAEGSTLRLTLGCLLADVLGIQLRRVGSGTRLTFAGGERLLSDWMDQHAYVTWAPHPRPWEPEKDLIGEWVLPLNLDHNMHGAFARPLSAIRAQARAVARSLPVVAADWTPDSGN